MKTESKVRQPRYLIEMIEIGRVRVTFYANELLADGDEGAYYQYDKYTMDMLDRPAIEKYISENLDALISMCVEKEFANAAAEARNTRNQLLQESDASMSIDRIGIGSIDTEDSANAIEETLLKLQAASSGEWAQYRKALRDIPQQPGFPFDIKWPEKPKK